jgi:hypothetical protein
MASGKYLHELLEANKSTPLPFDVLMTTYSGKPLVYAVVYKCDQFAVLEDINGNAQIVAYDCEDCADGMIEDDRQYQAIVQGNASTTPEPRTVKVAIYAFQKGSFWYQSAMYYKDDSHFAQLNQGTTVFKRVGQSEIEVSV